MDEVIQKKINQAAAVLKGFGAREVYVFGSVVRGRFTEDSDVDMAVAGLPPRDFFRAYARAANVFDCELDLVDLEDDTPFTQYLREKGGLVRVG